MDKTFLEIVKSGNGNYSIMWDIVELTSNLLEEVRKNPNHKKMIEDFLMISEAHMCGHYNEELAMLAVAGMKPLHISDLNRYMTEKGLSPEKVYEAVRNIESIKMSEYMQKGIKLPPIPKEYNMYDYYVCMASKIDHNYITIGEDMTNGAVLVYESLSDHDGGTRKVWDKTHKYIK